jgi:hypothetical protein
MFLLMITLPVEQIIHILLAVRIPMVLQPCLITLVVQLLLLDTILEAQIYL